LRQGSTQLFLTPGVIFRSVLLMDWLKFAVGRAISSPARSGPAYNGSFILSARLYF
jgi:hypothetical protein